MKTIKKLSLIFIALLFSATMMIAGDIIEFEYDDWNSGHTGRIKLKNYTNKQLNSWTLEFYYPYKITNIWNAKITDHSGNHYVIESESYNGNVSPDGVIYFGFNANPGNIESGPENIILNNQPLDSGTPVEPDENSPPTVLDDTAEVMQGKFVTVNVLENDTDSDGDSLIISNVSVPQHGAASISNNSIIYTPAADYYGTDSFNYTVNDSNGGTASGKVTIKINKAHDTPPASSGNLTVKYSVSGSWGSGAQLDFIITNSGANNVNGWFVEFDAAGLSIDQIWNAEVLEQSGSHFKITNLNVAWNKLITSNGTRDFGIITNGVTSLKNLKVYAYGEAPGDVPANTIPVAGNDTATVIAGESVSINVLDNDTDNDGDSLTVISVSKPEQGQTVVNGSHIIYTAKSDYSGTDTFSYTASDGNSGEAQASVTVTVNAPEPSINYNPVANTDNVKLNKGESVLINVLSNDTDANSDQLTVVSVSSANHGTTALEGSKINYSTVNAEFVGKDQFTYTIEDGNGGTAVGVVNITVMPQLEGKFAYGEALQKSIYFYEAQRSGELTENNRVEWRDNSATDDGNDVGVDLTGGYYDAGDHVKFGLPMSYTMTMLAWGAIEYRSSYEKSGQLPYILEAVKWGTDWLIKAHTGPNELWGQVGNGGLDHAFWGAAEVMTMARPSYKIDTQNPGSELAGEYAAALASASILFKDIDPVYSSILLSHAIELFDFADNYRGKYHESITDATTYYKSWSGYYDELVWGAIWLYEATRDSAYLDKAVAYFDQYLSGSNWAWTIAWDDKTYGAVIKLAELTANSKYSDLAESWLDTWVGGNGIKHTAGGLAWLDTWGSLRYAANTAFLAFIYADKVNDPLGKYHDFAVKQIDYMLGDNPADRSYVVGFGNNPPKNPHHRGASGIWNNQINSSIDNRNILYGALVGGPASADDFDYQDDRSDYIANEVALDYNAAFTGALVRMYKEFGGEADPTFPPAPTKKTDEFFVEASINYETDNATEIRAVIHNRSYSPARSSSSLSFRYYFDLSEVFVNGYNLNDMFVSKNWIEGGTLSEIKAYDIVKNIYYVEVDFTGTEIFPGGSTTFRKEAQFRVGLKDGISGKIWNPNNDWSYQGLEKGNANTKSTPYIPVYEKGLRLNGSEPQ